MMKDAEGQAAPPQSFTHQQIRSVISGILLCIFLAAIDQTVVVPAVPAIAAELHGFGHLSWIVSAYLLTSTAATPIYGRLSDMYGRRALLLPALVVFAAASVLCALAQSLVQLVLFRGLQGIGGAGLMAMAQAAIADVVSPRERGRYQGYMASVWGVASVAGPVFGGYVADHLSWRWIFWVNLPLALIAMVLCDRALRILIIHPVKSRIDFSGAALLTGGVTSWLVVLSSGGVDAAWDSALTIGLAGLGLALFAGLAVLERRVSYPLLPPHLFTNATIVRGVAVAFFGSLALFGAIFLLPLYFQVARGLGASASGFLVVPFLGTNCVGAWVAGSLVRRTGKIKPFLLAGISCSVLGLCLLATAGTGTPMLLLVVYQVVLGAGIGAIMPTSLVMVQNAADRRDVGVATGCLLFLRSMGGAFGSTLVGALLAGGFARALAAHGLTASLDLGQMREGGSFIDTFAPAMREAAQGGLMSGFHLGFLACGLLMTVAMVVAFGMRDLPLRTSPGARPRALAH